MKARPNLRRKSIHVALVATRTDPVHALRLAEELRLVTDAIARCPMRSRLVVHKHESASLADFRRLLLYRRARYDFVHVSGHGPCFGWIPVSHASSPQRFAVAFADLLAAHCTHQATVLLMGCRTAALGKALAARGLRCIAFSGPLSDQCAMGFAEAFWDTLGAGHAVELAFEEARRAVAFIDACRQEDVQWFAEHV